ncbi:MAG: V-type ATP synthase subunit E family protein [Anaerosomatales bacterium]|nr:V-type ATP synthase subunit E family protein [Anaerosomatales bacterium]
MALADILEQIAADAEAEARAILEQAEAEARAVAKEAERRAAERSARIVADAEAEARREAEALLAAARLRARDEALAAKQALIAEALERVAEAIVAMELERYARFVARRIVAAARGDEEVLIAEADRERLAGLADAVEQAAREAGRDGLALRYAEEPAPVAHGVVLRGVRDSVDLSIEGLIAAERDRLVARLAEALFSTEAEEG